VSDSPPPLTGSAEDALLRVLAFGNRAVGQSNSTSQLTYFRDVADHLGVSAAALQRPFTVLSAGERQRVSLSWAIALNPLVLLLDEPTSHLDREATRKFEALIQQVESAVVCCCNSTAPRAQQRESAPCQAHVDHA
jgi:ATPase subunit of ABC transporter with duplicated ATPase domains